MSRMTFFFKLGESVRYRNYKYAPLKGLDTRCVVKTTSDVRRSHVRAREAKKTRVVKMSCETVF